MTETENLSNQPLEIVFQGEPYFRINSLPKGTMLMYSAGSLEREALTTNNVAQIFKRITLEDDIPAENLYAKSLNTEGNSTRYFLTPMTLKQILVERSLKDPNLSDSRSQKQMEDIMKEDAFHADTTLAQLVNLGVDTRKLYSTSIELTQE